MPLHQRQQIREAAKAQLVGTAPGYATSAQTRVFETRLVPWRKHNLPAIAVYVEEETSNDNGSAPRELKRSARLIVEAAVDPGANIDDALDAISLEIERAIHKDETLGGKCSDAQLTATNLDFFDEQGRIIGVAQLGFAVTYFTGAPDPADVTLDAFEEAHITTNLSGAQHADNQAKDIVVIPQV